MPQKGQVRCDQRDGVWACGGQWIYPKRQEGDVTCVDVLES